MCDQFLLNDRRFSHRRDATKDSDQILYRLVRLSAAAFLFNSVVMERGIDLHRLLGHHETSHREALHVGRQAVYSGRESTRRIDESVTHVYLLNLVAEYVLQQLRQWLELGFQLHSFFFSSSSPRSNPFFVVDRWSLHGCQVFINCHTVCRTSCSRPSSRQLL